MKTLLSLPQNLARCFHDVETERGRDQYFVTSDPEGGRVGSGGGTNWLLAQCHKDECPDRDFMDWLQGEKRILMHAGGQSRRLPAYAPLGKVLTPVPIFRWARGQRLGQTLLDLQLPLYRRIIEKAPEGLNTLIASGDVLIRAGRLQAIPQADVVCYGLWADPERASHHGVFVMRRSSPQRLECMLQKPSPQRIGDLMQEHLVLMDIGVWLLNARAVSLLMQKSTAPDGSVSNYDLYSQFGTALGDHPTSPDPELSSLTVAILPLPDGEFYHFGTSREMIDSTLRVQNIVTDQQSIYHLGVKPHPSLFMQNAHMDAELTSANRNVWVENSCVPETWTLTQDHVITGVPVNGWTISLPPGQCVDVSPWGETDYVLRPYKMDDTFASEEQTRPQFPVTGSIEDMGLMLQYMISGQGDKGRALYEQAPKVSATDIGNKANIMRLKAQRMAFVKENLPKLAANHRRSVFYQTNLNDTAHLFAEMDLPLPAPIGDDAPLMKRISDHMFRSQLLSLKGQDGAGEAAKAFGLLRGGLIKNMTEMKQRPRCSVLSDQIVWGRSPVRIDMAGGWTDTPPHSLTSGGNVVNVAVELNGQPPLQAYIKSRPTPDIVLRSIDLSASELVTTYEQLQDFAQVGSPFSIAKAALCLAGFAPQFSAERFATLEAQLKDFGCGIEVTQLSALPAGSGMGTSSILASTVLGAVNDFCDLGWDKAEICNRTLALEQLLTTGGGWQDQYGGTLHGLKLLRTQPGFDQTPTVHWLPDTLFTDPVYRPCHLLYYTGITRTAKRILAEIVRNMFLFDTRTMALLEEMKSHALELHQAIQSGNFEEMGRLVARSWRQNQALDQGTNPPEVQSIIAKVEDLCLGLKLPGAGGGGFLYVVAKDAEAAALIRQRLTQDPPNRRARFVDMSLSTQGLQISRS